MAEPSASARSLGDRRETRLFTSAVILITIALIGFFLAQRTKGQEETWVQLAHTLSTNLGDISTVGEQVARGGQPAFLLLSARSAVIDGLVQGLNSGDSAASITAAPSADSHDRIDGVWGREVGGRGVRGGLPTDNKK